MRAASGGEVVILHELWTGDSFAPSLDEETSKYYVMPVQEHKQVFKSPIVECLWEKVKQVILQLAY